MSTDKFTWRDDDVVIHPSCVISVVIDGEPLPWYRASWSKEDGVDFAALLVDEMTGTPSFNPSTPEVAHPLVPRWRLDVEQVMADELGKRGVTLTALSPVPDGMATELRTSGDIEMTLPLVNPGHVEASGEPEGRMLRGIADVAADMSATEARWIATLHSRLSELRGMTLGTFAESVVAIALPGALHSAGGTDPYDLTWQNITIEVKSTRGKEWQLGKSSGEVTDSGALGPRADVYVLARHEGSDHRTGWSFYVVPRPWLDENGKKSIRMARIEKWEVPRTSADGLAEAVLGAKNAGPRT